MSFQEFESTVAFYGSEPGDDIEDTVPVRIAFKFQVWTFYHLFPAVNIPLCACAVAEQIEVFGNRIFFDSPDVECELVYIDGDFIFARSPDGKFRIVSAYLFRIVYQFVSFNTEEILDDVGIPREFESAGSEDSCPCVYSVFTFCECRCPFGTCRILNHYFRVPWLVECPVSDDVNVFEVRSIDSHGTAEIFHGSGCQYRLGFGSGDDSCLSCIIGHGDFESF